MKCLPLPLEAILFSDEPYEEMCHLLDEIYHEDQTTLVDVLVHACLSMSCRDLEKLFICLEIVDQKRDTQIAGDLANILCNAPHYIADGTFSWQQHRGQTMEQVRELHLFRNHEFISTFRVNTWGRYVCHTFEKTPTIDTNNGAASDVFHSLLEQLKSSTVKFHHLQASHAAVA